MGGLLRLFLPALIGALASSVGSLIGRACIALGIGFVTYKGIDVVMGNLRSLVVSGVSSIPSDAAGLLGYLWFDRAISMIISAVVASMALTALGGSIKKMVLK